MNTKAFESLHHEYDLLILQSQDLRTMIRQKKCTQVKPFREMLICFFRDSRAISN
jgi:hypothetical protein